MKKLFIVCLVCCFAALQASAQTSFEKGSNVVGLGIGFGGILYTGGYYTNKMPAISAYYENCVKDNLWDEKSSIGVGGLLGYSSAKWKNGDYGWKYTNFIIGARGALHYAFVKKLDTYTGFMLGYNIASHKEIGEHPYGWGYTAKGGGFTGSWFVGARYYFTDSFGIFSELGYGVSIFNIGASLKF